MEKKTEKTKDLFLVKALQLFAERGYEAVTVAQIAKAVGCTAPALYKHYAGKKELFDEIIKASENGYLNRMEQLRVDFREDPEQLERYLNMNVEEQIEVVTQLFLHTLHDEWPSAFRRLMTVEQFHMPQLAVLYNRRYVEEQFQQYKILFERMIEAGRLRGSDAGALAIMYLAPISLMIEFCDREKNKEEWAISVIETHIREFNRVYMIETDREESL